MADIPPEILLYMFSYFDLKSLIMGKGVCRLWRRLIPLSDIPSTRRAFLDLYMSCLEAPAFISTRSWLIDHLIPFNREAYIDILQKQYPALPEDFVLWILEWPARAAIGCVWPGLDRKFYDSIPDAGRWHGWNSLARIPPPIERLVLEDRDAGLTVNIPGILIWEWEEYESWLVLDSREILRGKVFDTMDRVVSMANGALASGYFPQTWLEWQGAGIQRLEKTAEFHRNLRTLNALSLIPASVRLHPVPRTQRPWRSG